MSQKSVALDIDFGEPPTEAELQPDNIVEIPLKNPREPWPKRIKGLIWTSTPIRNGNGAVPSEVRVLGTTDDIPGLETFEATFIVVGRGGGEICLFPA